LRSWDGESNRVKKQCVKKKGERESRRRTTKRKK